MTTANVRSEYLAKLRAAGPSIDAQEAITSAYQQAQAFRRPSADELGFLRVVATEGCFQLRAQIERCLVRELDFDGCLEIRVLEQCAPAVPVTGPAASTVFHLGPDQDLEASIWLDAAGFAAELELVSEFDRAIDDVPYARALASVRAT